MNENLSYAQALRILGGGRNRLITFLDTVASVGLGAWAASAAVAGGDLGIPLGLYELKKDITEQSQVVIRKVSEWRSGISRFDRTERLVAAHSVITISSFFEVLDFSSLPIGKDDLRLSTAEQVALATGGAPPESFGSMVKLLLQERLPVPEAHRPYVVVRAEIRALYDRLSLQVGQFIDGLTISETMTEQTLRDLRSILSKAPAAALSRYDDHYQALATDNYEFMAWVSLKEEHALGAGLEELTAHLERMEISHPGVRSRNHLIMSYKAALREPVTGSNQAPEDAILPPLAEAYINSGCLVAEVGPADADAPAVAQWWDKQQAVPDLEQYIVGYLTSLRSTQAPLVVLGEPGSGKSKLTEVLAARLCDSDFLPIRVALGEVAAESLIQEQIEQAIFNASGDRANWHDLLSAAPDDLPVVLLDGFDELLQAVGANRYDYLERVKEFQRKQATIGRPVAVIVTTRIVVADRVRFPRGSLCLRLRPFTDIQIIRWLETWNYYNAKQLRQRGLVPLESEAVLQHRGLAEQPLLLLMLAMFDATANGLQGNTLTGEAELYRALLTDFALREVRKSADRRSLAMSHQVILAEAEVLRLSIAALAMFARSVHLVSAAELNSDLSALFPESTVDASTPAQRVVGLFFFIHKSEVRPSGGHADYYEFLHETFEEFLVAWLAVRTLRDLARARPKIGVPSTAYGGRLNDGFLYAVLSFRCLAARNGVVNFLRDLIRAIPIAEREECQQLIHDLIGDSLYSHQDRSWPAYEPVQLPFPHRAAAYSANLITMLVFMSEDGVTLRGLFGEERPTESWHAHTHLWKGMLGSEEWEGLLHTIRAEVASDETRLDVERGSPVLLTRHLSDPPMPIPGSNADQYELSIPANSLVGIALRELTFLGNWHEERILLDAIPFLRISGGWLLGGGGVDPEVSPAYLLAELDYTRDAPPGQRIELYRRAFRLTAGFRPAIRGQLLLRLRQEVAHFGGKDVLDLLLQTFPAQSDDDVYASVVNEFWRNARDPESRRMAAKVAGALRSQWPDAAWDSLAPDLLRASADEASASTPPPRPAAP